MSVPVAAVCAPLIISCCLPGEYLGTQTQTLSLQAAKEDDKEATKRTCDKEKDQVVSFVVDMSSLCAAAVLVPLSCVIVVILVAPPCTGKGSVCNCNDTNSRCDESGVCRCDPGWDGEHCDRCVPMPGCCHGSCQQPWQCTCEEGWGGRFCDKDLSVCSKQQPCRHGATCVMEDNGEYTCVCPEGFHGRNCELREGPCHQKRSQCKNGGLCEDADGFAEESTCYCLAGFTGSHCEINVDDCQMRPCANGATCLDGVNRFSCICPAGFTGRFCTVNVDDCVSQPCHNGARCLDLAGGFRCICTLGYTGTTCESTLRANQGWEGVNAHWTTEGQNHGNSPNQDTSSRHGDRLLKVTVSEHSGGNVLSAVQLKVLLVLAMMTVCMVALTAGLVLQGRCGHAFYWPLTSLSSQWQGQKMEEPGRSDKLEYQISFLNAAEAEKWA